MDEKSKNHFVNHNSQMQVKATNSMVFLNLQARHKYRACKYFINHLFSQINVL